MSDKIKFALIALAGVVLTVSLLIGVSAYNHQSDISRDEFLYSHCQHVSEVSSQGGFTTTNKWECKQ